MFPNFKDTIVDASHTGEMVEKPLDSHTCNQNTGDISKNSNSYSCNLNIQEKYPNTE